MCAVPLAALVYNCLAAPPRLTTAGLLAQDFGARDPFEGELSSNFGDRVLGNADTSHIVRRARDRSVAPS